MSENWKPGDVAMVSTDLCGDTVALRTGVPSNMGWAYTSTSGNCWTSDPDAEKAIRPLVVIDPETILPGWGSAGLLSTLLEAAADIVAESESGREVFETILLRNLSKAFDDAIPPPKPYREAFVGSAPWPVVSECHSWNVVGHECPQCAWEHEHDWVAWTNAQGSSWPPNAVPIRCSKCGGRKCDADDCSGQRHRHKHDEVTP